MMKNPKEQRSKNALVWGIGGFLFGLVFVVLAMLFALTWLDQPFTIEAILRLQQNVLFWLIDTLPFILAIAFAIAGDRHDQLLRARRNTEATLSRHKAEIQHINESLTTQNQEHKELEAVISHGKQQWEATFDSVEDLILLTDENGVISRCNRATGEAFQTGFRQLIGRQIEELLSGISEGPAPNQKAEMRFPRLDGWYEVSNIPLLVDDNPAGKIYILRNITELKETLLDLQRQTQYYELVVNNSPLAIVTLDLNDRVVTCNQAFETLFGYQRQDVLGQSLDALIAPQDLEEEASALTECVKLGETVRKLTRRKRNDGSLLPVEVFGFPLVLWGKQFGVIAMYHDVSDLLPESQEAEPGLLLGGIAEIVQDERLVEMDSDWQPEELVAAKVDAPEPEKKTRNQFTPISKIEGIGPAYAHLLSAVGIRSTEELLEAGATRPDREELAEKTGISSKLLLGWINMADLMRVPGIGEEYSQLLERAGVDTVRELRQRKPQNLLQALVEANETNPLVRRLPSLSDVEGWVQSAKELDAVLKY